jgi:hypothetical protein
MRAKITKRVVDSAAAREATYLVRDTEVRGFVLVVTQVVFSKHPRTKYANLCN